MRDTQVGLREKRACKLEGCSAPKHALGWCNAHYKRFKLHGHPLRGRGPRAQHGAPLSWVKEVALPFSGDECLAWPFSRTTYGYGEMRLSGRAVGAHRYICEASHGPAPSSQHQAAHSCGNGHLGCVNWRHISWKTPAENAADRAEHGTQVRGEDHPLSKLTEEDVLEIRTLTGIQTQRELAERFNVSITAVHHVQTRKNWGWLK